MIINSIAIPRTISTSLMYAFDQHSEIAAIDEPFYAYYLNETGLTHPGHATVLKEMPVDYNSAKKAILEKARGTKHLYIKNMAHHILDVDMDFLKKTTVFFLFRHPARVIFSMQKVYPTLDIRDVGIKRQAEIFEICSNEGISNIVVESPWILTDPETHLKMIVDRLGLSFERAMLKWPKGPKSIDGSWGKYWYANTHSSTGFTKSMTETELPQLSGSYKELLDQCMPYYLTLKSKALN